MSHPHGRPFTPSRSAPVYIGRTPGAFFAFAVSMPRMRACACGERRKNTCAWRAIVTSSVNCPAPVRKRASSLRRTDWPMYPVSLAPISFPHRSGALRHRLDDVVIAGAPAEVAFETLANRVLVGAGVPVDEIDRAQHHSRRAEATLQPVTILECR